MKIKRFMCALLSLCITASLSVAAADGEYEQKVKLTKTMYTPKTIYVDDDFNDRTDGECVANSDYEKKIPTAEPGAIAESEDGNTYVNLSKEWASARVEILGSNNIQCDKLALSFKFRHNNAGYFQIRFGNANPTVLVRSNGSGGNIGMYKDPKASTTIWTFDASCTEWSQLNLIFEKVSAGGEDKMRIAEAYLNNELLDMSRVTANLGSDILYCSDWWSGNETSKAICITQVSKAGINIDDIMLYEPYDFNISSAEYDDSSNEIRLAMTQGIDEGSMDSIKIVGEDKTVDCAVAMDASDETNRTILITPSETLDTENGSYYIVVGSIKSLGGAAVTDERFLIAKEYADVENVNVSKSDAEVSASFDVKAVSDGEVYAAISAWKGDNCIDFALQKITLDTSLDTAAAEVKATGAMADADKVQFFLIDSPEKMNIISDVWEAEF